MDQVITFIDQMSYWHWFAFGAILMIVEIVTPTFYFLWIGIAAALVGVLKLFVPDLSWQIAIAVFGVMSVVSTVIWSAFNRRGKSTDAASSLNKRAHGYTGRRAVVAEGFRSGRGPILLDDTRWQAISDDGADLAPGSSVEVTGSDGATLRVKAA
jgi:membrane protein implicated in regulation of membrane protease activity